MEYPKINSLWKREGWYFDQDKKNSPDYQKGRQSFIEGDYASAEFGNIKLWDVEEKVDGTNIRIHFTCSLNQPPIQPIFMGRTANSQLPCHLLQYLQSHFTEERLQKVFPDGSNVFLFGEGYGPKIQGCGGNYRGDPGFILFDVMVGNWWLKREDVYGIANQLQVPHCPPIGRMSEAEIVEYVKSKPLSRCSRNPQMMEGVICRSEPLVLYRKGIPIMFKLKCKEF